ncbi:MULTISPECIES: hypothetical protein [Butyricimonas]|nr:MULTISPECIES: hypothetical protein [Butyricimonas]
MKYNSKIIIREARALAPFVVTIGVIALLYLSIHVLQDFTKIYYIYTTY